MAHLQKRSPLAWPAVASVDRLTDHRRAVCELVLDQFEIDQEDDRGPVTVTNDQGDVWKLTWDGQQQTIHGDRYAQKVVLEVIFEPGLPTLYDVTGTDVRNRFVGRLREDDPAYEGALRSIVERYTLREALDGRTGEVPEPIDARPRPRL